MQVMILAAGLGTRLWPLTADRGKPAVPFLGRPLIAGLVGLCRAHGFSRFVVNTHHQPESIQDALEPLEAEGLHISYSHEPQILGTAGALALARDRGLLVADQPTLVINGKLYMDLDLSLVRQGHEQSDALVSMVLRPNPAREHFKEVLISGDRVTGFGKSRVPEGPQPLLFTGVHVLAPQVLASLEPRFSDTVADVYPALIADQRVRADLRPEGVWWELSTLERYLQLQLMATGGAVVMSERAFVAPGAVVERSVLWEGARVEAGAEVKDSVLAAGVVIRPGERVEHMVVVQADLVAGDDRGEPLGDRRVLRLT